MNLVPVILNYFCAVLWFFMGMRDGDIGDFACALVFLAAGIVHTVRYMKKRNAKDEG